MPRSRNVYHTEFPYHINARTNNGYHFPCELNEAWEIYQNALLFCSWAFETRILGFTMMSNHFHLYMVTPKGNLSQFMKYFMKRTSDDIRRIRDCENHLYGTRYYATLVKKSDCRLAVFKYIYQNPVRARIVENVFDYRYSTLRGFIGLEKLTVPVHDEFHFFENFYENLQWLAEIYDRDEIEYLRYALQHQEFKFPPNESAYLDDTRFHSISRKLKS